MTAEQSPTVGNSAQKSFACQKKKIPGARAVSVLPVSYTHLDVYKRQIDINLRDMKGNTRKLSELKGKAVIVDFTVYQSAVSATHNYMLRDLYDKYAAQGLEIYQVSLDADEHYWKTTADNLPWICVRDGNGIYSSIAASYNVKNVPSVFLVNKNNELSARGESIKDLEAAVKALL